MSRRLALLLVLALAAILPGCTNGDECDTCTTDSDCRSGFSCSNFLDSDGQVVDRRCGSGVGATTCRVR